MIALDLFAGHGWGVACQKLGIEEYGVEIMPEAVATRTANGMTTLYNDVWTGLEEPPSERRSEWEAVALRDYDLLIASPPCQTFSMAGGGAGRRALDDVLGLIRSGAYHDPARLRAFGETHDPRTALVLTPLAHVARDLPLYVVFEQVPPVLPVWEACADEMRRWGYSVWTGIVNAEQYGVPQTRRRAILIARADGKEATPPQPTHSRYYSREPLRLDEGVLPWVSMAEALGWGMTERPMITAGNAIGRAEGVGGSGGKAAIEREKGRGAWIGNQYPNKAVRERQRRDADLPVPTILSGSRSAKIERRLGEDEARERYADRRGSKAELVTVVEAALLQSYPADFDWNVEVVDPKTGKFKPVTKTKQFLQIGNAVPPLMAEAILREVLSS